MRLGVIVGKDSGLLGLKYKDKLTDSQALFTH